MTKGKMKVSGKESTEELLEGLDLSMPETGYVHGEWPFTAYDDRVTVSLDYETADRITVCTLKAHLQMIYDREHDHKVNGAWYHEEDIEYDRKIKKSIRRLLKYFGEEE